MNKILFMETDSSIYEHWKLRLESLDYQVDVLHDHDEDTLDLSPEKYALAILRATYDEELMKAANAILHDRASSVMAIADDDHPTLHRIAYNAGMEDCVNDSVDKATLDRKIRCAIELHQLHQDLVQSQKLQAIGLLAAGIAHEINTPIQYVGDNARFFGDACDDFGRIFDACNEVISHLEDGESPATALIRLREMMLQVDLPYLQTEVPAAINQTIDGIDRVAAIVRAIKTFAHAAPSPEPTPTNIVAAIETTVTLARNEWKYVSDVELDLDESLTDVPCIGGQINQVILNLIVNAAHAIEERFEGNPNEKGHIEITTRRMKDHARILVTDDGSGIPRNIIDRIFDPFFTTKQSGKGTGQGLAIVREIVVEGHGGFIDVKSDPGHGTTFIIDLPLRRASDGGHHQVSDPDNEVKEAVQ